jgi:hypothetical protein
VVIAARAGVMRRELAAVALCLVFVRPVPAQQPPPSVSDTADRPGFADSPVLLGRGHIQVESGVAWEHEGRGADLTKTLTWPQLELHAGLAPDLEVSVAWDGLVSGVSNPDGRSTGGADVRLGAKFGLVNRPGVDAALIGYVQLPVGSGSVSSGYADPLARFAWGIAVSNHVGLSGTADLGAGREPDGRVRPKPAASAALGATVVGTLDGFVGMVAESPAVGSRPDVWSVEAGLLLPLGVRSQIDVWVSRRLAGGSDNWIVGVGVVRRLRSSDGDRNRAVDPQR